MFGVPQARERVYFVCLRKDFSNEYDLKYTKPKESYENVLLNDILEKDIDENLYIDRTDIILNTNSVENQLKPIRIGQVNKGGQRVKEFTALSVILLLYRLSVAVLVLEQVYII